jgi:hypothetical protein
MVMVRAKGRIRGKVKARGKIRARKILGSGNEITISGSQGKKRSSA